MPGEWAVIYLAYIASYERDLLRWYRATDNPLWRTAGFANRPSYDAAHYNFTRLEEHAEAFRSAASKLIHRAVEESGGLVAFDIHIDGTEAETHARLYHACRNNPRCSQRKRRRGHHSAKRSPAARHSASDARECRHEDDKAPTDNGPSGDVGTVVKKLKKRTIVRIGTCYWATMDGDAGARTYTGRKFWHGYYHLKAVDHYTGAVVAAITVSASVNEKDAYGELLNAVIENTGVVPRSVVGDKGFSYEEIFETNTRLGIASVFPYRAKNPHERRADLDNDLFDRHGVPRCKHCGGPGRFVSFTKAPPTPRIIFRCEAGRGAKCRKRQTLSCSNGWRFLTPISRTSETYWALRESHQHYEAAHWRWRDRWRVAGDNSQTRPLRRGLGCQNLRSHAALLCEWLLVCHRQGWMPGHSPQHNNKPVVGSGQEALDSFLEKRREAGLHLPPGPERDDHIEEVKEHKAQEKAERARRLEEAEAEAAELRREVARLTSPSG